MRGFSMVMRSPGPCSESPQQNPGRLQCDSRSAACGGGATCVAPHNLVGKRGRSALKRRRLDQMNWRYRPMSRLALVLGVLLAVTGCSFYMGEPVAPKTDFR